VKQIKPRAIKPIRKRRKREAGARYDYRWQQSREAFLKQCPLCVFCERHGRLTPATVVDHIVPHRGDSRLFWDTRNWQSLCKRCHDSEKQRIEKGQE